MPGFPYLWVKYVRGFDMRQHCAKCLIGTFSEALNCAKGATPAKPWGADVATGVPIRLDEDGAPFIYLCGVSRGYVWSNNLHVFFRPKAGAKIWCRTWNGYQVNIENGERLEIPTLPDGFRGLGKAFTTCRNFQAGWSLWGVGGTGVDGAQVAP
jgi:hypothetical protein